VPVLLVVAITFGLIARGLVMIVYRLDGCLDCQILKFWMICLSDRPVLTALRGVFKFAIKCRGARLTKYLLNKLFERHFSA